MRLEPHLFRCKRCGQEWHGALLVECPLDLAVRVMKAIRCPQGHANRSVVLLCGEEAVQAAQRLAAADSQGDVRRPHVRQS